MTIQVREAISDADPHQWLEGIGQRLTDGDRELLGKALSVAVEQYADRACADGEPLLSHWREVATLVERLRLDADSVAAALLGGLPEVDSAWREHVSATLSPQVAALVEGVARMAQIQALRSKVDEASRPAERATQLEALRKML